MRAVQGIGDLVGALDAFDGALAPGRVADLLRRCTVDERSLDGYLHFRDGAYTRNLIARRDSFELIAICWDRSVATAIHDHDDSDCAFVMLRGSLRCEDWECSADGRDGTSFAIRRCGETSLHRGDVDLRTGSLSLHRVATDGEPAVSLHVYARPIDSCLIFEESGSCRRVASHYDTMPAPGPNGARLKNRLR